MFRSAGRGGAVRWSAWVWGIEIQAQQLKRSCRGENLPGGLNAADLKNHHIEKKHSRFTNCTRQYRRGFPATEGVCVCVCVCQRPPSCCALAACISFARTTEGSTASTGEVRWSKSVTLETRRSKAIKGEQDGEGGPSGLRGELVLCLVRFFFRRHCPVT